MYRISSKSDDFSLTYGDLTIFEMAAAAILDFKNLQILSFSPSSSSFKISLKSDNRSMSYGQKSDFQDGGRRHLEFF